MNAPAELLNLSLNAKAVLPEGAVLLALLGTLLVDLAGEQTASRWAPPICYIGLGAARVLRGLEWNAQIQEAFLGAFIADNLAIAFRGVIALSTLVSLLISWKYAEQNGSPVGEFAAKIRRVRPPEPYKGKGIRYADEQVKIKAGKTAA